MRTEIKICGIKNEEEIAIINQFPVDYIGMIFAPSKRQVTVEKAARLRKLIRRDIKVVGVFVNEDINKVKEIIGLCSLDAVQLHGEETVDYCSKIDCKVWKSILVSDETSLEIIESYKNVAEGILLDTYSKDERGGTGQSFNWDMVEHLSEKYPIILAGGISPENAVAAITKVKPIVLDLNSGLETNLIKDKKKIEALFYNLKEAFENE